MKKNEVYIDFLFLFLRFEVVIYLIWGFNEYVMYVCRRVCVKEENIKEKKVN